MNQKFLVFDICGDYAHFKKYYTTSSPLTFSIPPRTAIVGIVSAILGVGKNDYFKIMKKEKAKIAIQIVNPIKKIRMGMNLIDTKVGWRPIKKDKLTGRTQIHFEFLKDPRFRIYFSHSEKEIQDKLKIFLNEHKSFYTPYLGISELICDFKFLEELEGEKIVNSENFFEISTAIPLDEIINVEFQVGKYFKERIPTEMDLNRVVNEYREVIYEIEGKKIKCKIKNLFKLENGEMIVLL